MLQKVLTKDIQTRKAWFPYRRAQHADLLGLALRAGTRLLRNSQHPLRTFELFTSEKHGSRLRTANRTDRIPLIESSPGYRRPDVAACAGYQYSHIQPRRNEFYFVMLLASPEA
jgi:hypothetical protein